jgi:hypothetical protein
MIMGVNLINYPEEIGTNTATLPIVKIFINNVITTSDTFMSINLVNFYLMTLLKLPKFTKIKLSLTPQRINSSRTKPHLMGGYTSNAVVVCTAFPMPAASDTISYQCLNEVDTTTVPSFQGCRSITPALSNSPLLSTSGIKYSSCGDAIHLIDALK